MKIEEARVRAMTSEFVPPLRGFVDVNGLSPPPATPGWLALPWLIGTASPPINAHHRAEADLARAVHQVAGSFVPCEDWRLQIVLQQATAAPTAQISSAVARAPRAMSAEANLARVARHAAHAAQQAAVNPGPVVNRAFSHEPPLPYYGATISAVESFHCWSVSGGHVVVSLRAALEAGSDVGAARAELTAMFEAAGVASDRIAIELTTPRGGNLDFAA